MQEKEFVKKTQEFLNEYSTELFRDKTIVTKFELCYLYPDDINTNISRLVIKFKFRKLNKNIIYINLRKNGNRFEKVELKNSISNVRIVDIKDIDEFLSCLNFFINNILKYYKYKNDEETKES